MQKIKYSFVLPAYKARFFREALDSILAQTYKDFELIIVNDASPEDLDSIVKSYDDPRIRYYVNEQNIGGKDLVAQWNHCLKYAEGDYIVLATDDDVYFPQYLEKMDALVQKYPEVNVFRPRIQIIDEAGNPGRIYGYLEGKINAIEYVYNLHRDYIGTGIGYYLFNKKALLAIGGFVHFPMAWGTDDATVMEMSRNGMGFEKDLLFSFRMSGDNISTINDYPRLKQKIICSKLVYEYLQDYISHLTPNTKLEEQYLDFINTDLDNMMRAHVAKVMNEATFVDAMRVIPILCSLKFATPIFIVKRIVKKFMQLIR